MRTRWTLVVGLVIAMACVAGLYAQDKDKDKDKDKEVTLKGSITCAKCDLKQEKACMTVIKVTEKGKDLVYYFDKESHKKHHAKICQTPMDGTVVGKVGKDGKKMTVTASKVEFK